MYWEIYGPFAQGSFDSIGFNQNAKYSFKILKKNYNGRPILIPPDTVLYPDPIIQCLCAGNPGVLRYLNDDVIGIKGSEFILTLINKDNQLPLSTFYSEEEDTYKLVVDMTYEVSSVETTVRIFEGFLIQEDSNEVLTDIAHEIQLSFTDNLGALKNIDFYQASMLSATYAANLRSGRDNMEVIAETATKSPIIKIYNPTMNTTSPVVGDFIFLNDSPSGDVAYKIIKIETDSVATYLWIDRTPITFSLTSSVYYTVITGSDVYSRIKLADVLRICLHGTNMNLSVVMAANLKAVFENEIGGLNFLDYVYIDGKTFLQNQNNWLSCYDVLDRFCKRFNISLFQQDGKWHFIRYHEMSFYDGIIPGLTYNSYLANTGNANITNKINFGTGSDIETGIEQTIERPYNFNIENFAYNNPNNLLYNADLQILGPKLNQYTLTIDSIAHTVKEYEAPGFNLNGSFTGLYKIFIRIWTNNVTGDEYDRVLVVQEVGQQAENIEVIISNQIEMNAGDNVKIGFTYRTLTSNPNVTNRFAFRNAIDGTLNNFYYVSNLAKTVDQNKQYLFVPYSAINPPGVNYYVDSLSGGDDTQSWRDISLTTYPTRTGVFTLGLGQHDRTVSAIGETWYKNLSVELIYNSAGQSKINGQEHKSSVNKIVKNNSSIDVYMDDTVRNSLSGTFFYNPTLINLVRQRTTGWRFANNTTSKKLGEITTIEIMKWKLIPRTKIECRILGIINSSDIRFKMLNGLIFLLQNNTCFIFGKAEFNLKEDTINATLYELYKPNEASPSNPYRTDINYEFKYLYK